MSGRVGPGIRKQPGAVEVRDSSCREDFGGHALNTRSLSLSLSLSLCLGFKV